MYGQHGIESAPTGVTALFEANRLSVERVFESGNSLQLSGSETAKFYFNEHLKQQELTHYRNKEDVCAFYVKAFNQSRGYEQVFVQASMDIERSRIVNDKLNRLLFSKSASGLLTSPGVCVLAPKKFANTKLHEECKVQIREMVLRNPIETIYIKNERKYCLFFCSHVLCPIPGSDLQEKVRYLNEMCLYKPR